MTDQNHYKERLEQSFDMFVGGIEKKSEIDNGDLIPVQDWINQCKNAGFIDYDGNGHLAVSCIDGWIIGKPTIYPSDIVLLNLNLPEWATHVLWFNR